MKQPLQIFCCYAREDQLFLLTLKKHLMPLQREGRIIIQADIDISPGEDWEQRISYHLNTAQIIILLISADFIASEYCYSKEMKRAIERHERGEACVIPIILRPTRWTKTAVGKLQVLPTNAEPVTSRNWHTQDEAFFDVAKGIEKVVDGFITDLRIASSKNHQVHFNSEEKLDSHERSEAEMPTKVKQELLTVYLAIDMSGSMSGSPLTEAKRALEAFVRQCNLTTTSIGLIAFADRVHVESEATQDTKKILKAIQSLAVGKAGYGNAAEPFSQISSLLRNVEGTRYAIVLADGVWSSQDVAIEQAQHCHAAGIEIITVGFGGADRIFLEKIATASEQSFFVTMNKLSEIYEALARNN